jgi:hypothetical protein
MRRRPGWGTFCEELRAAYDAAIDYCAQYSSLQQFQRCGFAPTTDEFPYLQLHSEMKNFIDRTGNYPEHMAQWDARGETIATGTISEYWQGRDAEAAAAEARDAAAAVAVAEAALAAHYRGEAPAGGRRAAPAVPRRQLPHRWARPVFDLNRGDIREDDIDFEPNEEPNSDTEAA